LTIPFWRDLIGDMDFVICVRNPADVAASITQREHNDGLHLDGSVALWLRYTRAALDNTLRSRRIVLVAEDLLADPHRQIARLGAFVGASDARVRSVQRTASELIDPQLWHHRSSADGIARVREVCPDAADLYASLRTAAARQSPAPASIRSRLRPAWAGVALSE
jgi:hypothetical protein